MNKCDMNYFIEEMGRIGDYWTLEEVKDVYGRMSLEDALCERKETVDSFLQGISNILSGTNEKECSARA